MDIYIGVYLEILSPRVQGKHETNFSFAADLFFYKEKIDQLFVVNREEDDETLEVKKYIALSNFGGGNVCLTNKDRYEDNVLNIPDFLKLEKEFWEKHADDVKYLQEDLGCEVEIKIGVIQQNWNF